MPHIYAIHDDDVADIDFMTGEIHEAPFPVYKAMEIIEIFNGASTDVCKFGKQWVVLIDAIKREYGSANR